MDLLIRLIGVGNDISHGNNSRLENFFSKFDTGPDYARALSGKSGFTD